MTVLEPACGSGVRPFVWPGAPVLGTTFGISYNLFPLPREDETYDVQAAWIIVSLIPPAGHAEPVFMLPGACPLYLHVGHELVLVWQFHGKGPFKDLLLERKENARAVKLTLPVANDPRILGMRAWTQVVQLRHDGFATSALHQITFGRY